MGTLQVVATPIGNLEDISIRALRTLAEADLLFAEDTRRARVLLDRHEVAAKPVSLHEHNEAARVERALSASSVWRVAVTTASEKPAPVGKGLPSPRKRPNPMAS